MSINKFKYYLEPLNLLLLILFLCLLNVTAKAQGNGISGGGDTECEARIQEIQKDLAKWLSLNKNGPSLLKLPEHIKLKDYVQKMSKFVNTEVECTTDKVFEKGTEKTCRFDLVHKISGSARITCNSDRIRKTKEDRQYQLIHHEIAGLAQLEISIGSKSIYDVSGQISKNLETIPVKKLAIKSSNKRTFTQTLEESMDMLVNENCKEASFETYEEFSDSRDYLKLKTCIDKVEKGLKKLEEDPPGKTIIERNDNGSALAYYCAELGVKIYKIHLIEIHSQF